MTTESPSASPDTQAREPSAARRIAFVAAPLLIFLALAITFMFALTSGDPSRIPSALLDKPAPQTDFAPLAGLSRDGTPVAGFTAQDLASGKVSVVNFWASWCAPCIQEHPQLVELAQRTDANIFGVNYKDDPVAAKRVLGRYGNPFTAVGVDDTGRKAIEWGVYGMPETYIIAGNGRITYKHTGPISPRDLETKILPAIEQARSIGASSEKPAQSS